MVMFGIIAEIDHLCLFLVVDGRDDIGDIARRGQMMIDESIAIESQVIGPIRLELRLLHDFSEVFYLKHGQTHHLKQLTDCFYIVYYILECFHFQIPVYLNIHTNQIRNGSSQHITMSSLQCSGQQTVIKLQILPKYSIYLCQQSSMKQPTKKPKHLSSILPKQSSQVLRYPASKKEHSQILPQRNHTFKIQTSWSRRSSISDSDSSDSCFDKKFYRCGCLNHNGQGCGHKYQNYLAQLRQERMRKKQKLIDFIEQKQQKCEELVLSDDEKPLIASFPETPPRASELQRIAEINESAELSTTKFQFQMRVQLGDESYVRMARSKEEAIQCLLELQGALNDINIKQIVEQQNRKQLEWIANNKDSLDQSEFYFNLNRQPFSNYSPDFLLYRLRIKNCERCWKKDNYKFIQQPSSQGRTHLIICSECYFRQQSSDYHSTQTQAKYMTMNCYMAQMLLKRDSYDSVDIERSSDVAKEAWHLKQSIEQALKRMAKGIGQSVGKLSPKIIEELEVIKQFVSKEGYNKQMKVIFEDKQCQCKYNCCHCNYHHDQQNKQCELHDLKQKQDNLLKNLKILSIEETLKKTDQKKLFKSIYKQFQYSINKYFLNIQHAVKTIMQDLSQISLLNHQFIQQLENKYHFQQQAQTEQPAILAQRKKQSARKGQVNYLNHHQLVQYPSSIQQLKLNYCDTANTHLLRTKIESFDKLPKITVSNDILSQVIIKDIVSFNTGERKMELLSEKTIKSLKSLQFVGNSSKFIDLIESLNSQNSFKDLNIYGNFFNNFQRFNERFHFLQDQTVVKFPSLSVEQIEKLSLVRPIRHIYVQFCDSEGLSEQQLKKQQSYFRLLTQSIQEIEGIMFGHPNGFSRKISKRFYNLLLSATNLKTIHLNHIKIDEQYFVRLLNHHPGLEALYLNSCQNMSKQCCKTVMKLTQLKKLGLVQVSLSEYASLPSLETLIIEGDLSNKLNTHLQIIIKNAKLRCLNLFNCTELNQQSIRQILQKQLANQAELQSINLGFTKTNNQTLKTLSLFKSIRKLHIGGTNVNLHQFMYDLERGQLQNLKKIERLSLKGMKQITKKFQRRQLIQDFAYDYYNNVFSTILQHFKLLSHLDISCNKVIDNRAVSQGLEYLVFLTIKDTKYVKKASFSHKGTEKCPKSQSDSSNSKITEAKARRQTRKGGNRKYLKQIFANAT